MQEQLRRYQDEYNTYICKSYQIFLFPIPFINFINLNMFVKIRGISGKQRSVYLYEVYMLKKGMNIFRIV